MTNSKRLSSLSARCPGRYGILRRYKLRPPAEAVTYCMTTSIRRYLHLPLVYSGIGPHISAVFASKSYCVHWTTPYRVMSTSTGSGVCHPYIQCTIAIYVQHSSKRRHVLEHSLRNLLPNRQRAVDTAIIVSAIHHKISRTKLTCRQSEEG